MTEGGNRYVILFYHLVNLVLGVKIFFKIEEAMELWGVDFEIGC